VSIAVVTNPRSRHNRRNPDLSEALASVLGDGGEIVTPDDLDALAATADRLRERGVDLLCVNGGDGTLHQVLTALIRSWGEATPLPRICLLRGGTMNIVADSVGVRLGPQDMLARVVAARREGAPIATTTRRTMRIVADDRPPLYGFLAGNGIIARFLELYYEQPDPGPRDAALLLLRGACSAVVQGPLIRQLMRPYVGRVVADGVPLRGLDGAEDRWTAVALGTVEQMGLGFRVFPMTVDHPDVIGIVAIGSSVARLAAELPSVYLGRGVHRVGNSTHAVAELVLEADEPIPLMVDGDFCRADAGRVRIGLGPAVNFVIP
jgi:diacylglycerol kinase (ATP)